MDLIVNADLKNYITGDYNNDSEFISKVSQVISIGSETLLKYLGFNPVVPPVIETNEGTGIPPYIYKRVLDLNSNLIRLPYSPIYSITEVKINGYIYDESEYITINETGILQFINARFQGSNLVEIKYNFGYETLPLDLKDSICKYCAILFTSLTNKNYDVKSQIMGDITINYLQGIPWNIKQVWDSYSC